MFPDSLRPNSLACSALLAFLCTAAPAQTPSEDEAAPPPPAPASAPPPAPAVTTLEAVEVVGRRQGGGYEPGDVSGTKTALPLRELPQSVRVMSRQAIDDLGALRLDDVLDYVGGISRQNNFGGLWDNIAIRGLPGNENTGMAMLLNGLAANRGFNAPRDTADLERVEFLKGPAAALYGASEPGGIVNLVTKKPRWLPATSLEFYAGSYDSYRVAADTTGPLGKALAYRLNVAAEDRGSFRDFVQTRRTVVAPAFTWGLEGGGTVDYTGQWLEHRTPLDRGVQAIDGQLGRVPRSRFPGEPGDGDVTVRNLSHQLVLDRDLDAQWRGRAALSYREATLQGLSTEPLQLLDDDRTLRRQRRDRDYASDDLGLQLEAQGRVPAGSVVHEVLAGLEAYRFNLDQRMLRVRPAGDAYAIDLLDPVYGQPLPTPLPTTDTREEQRGTALTLQDALVLSPQWRVVAGVRHDRVDQVLDDRLAARRTEQRLSETLPRAGVSYLPDRQWTLYANAGRSFRANASDSTGRTFEPESGRAFEVGAKWEDADQRLGATVAVFDITKRNVLVLENVTSGALVPVNVTSRGVELDVAGQLTRDWRLTGSLAYNDVATPTGRLLNVPRVNGSVLAVYEGAFEGGSRYGVGGGATHMGRRLGETGTDFELPAYTTAKLVAYWRATPTLRLSLDVDNLFDTTYYTSSYSRLWVTPGAPRSFMLGVQAKF